MQALTIHPETPSAAHCCADPLDGELGAPLFRALGDPTRSRLLACLVKCGRPCSATELAGCCELDFSTVHRHLAVLVRSSLVTSRKEGRTVWYEADAEDLASHFHRIGDHFARWAAVPA